MAGRADIEAGKAHVKLYVQNSMLVKGLAAAKASLQSFGRGAGVLGAGFAAIGTGIIAPLIGAVAHFARVGSELNDMSARTGIAAGALAELKFAAEQTGAQLGDVEMGIRKMQKTLADAARGAKEARQAILFLHLTLEDLAGLPPDAQFAKIAEKIAQIPDPAKRTAAAMAIFGKSAASLLPMIAALTELRKEAQALGLVPTDKAVAMADKLGDAFDKMKSVISATMFEIGAALAPTILPILEMLKGVALAFQKMAKENSVIIKVVFAVGAAFVALGVALGAIANALFAVSLLWGFAATVLAFIISPLGIVVITIAAVSAAQLTGIAMWARYTESGRAAVKSMMEFLAPLLAFAKEVFGGIADAFMAGDLQLAARIAWAGVLVAFEAAKLAMMRVWFRLKEVLLSAWGEVSLGIRTSVAFMAGIFAGLLDQLVPGWQAGMKLIGLAVSQAWKTFRDTALGAFAVVRVGLDGLIARLKSFLTGLQIAAKAAVQIAPQAFQGKASTVNDIMKFGGLDVGKIFESGAGAAAGENAKGRAELDQANADRKAGDNDALAAQEELLDKRREELDLLAKEAAAAREAADKKGPAKPELANIEAAGRGATSTVFSSSFAAAASGGSNSPVTSRLDKMLVQNKRAADAADKLLKKKFAGAFGV